MLRKILFSLFVFTFLYSFTKNVSAYTDPGYPYGISAPQCRTTCYTDDWNFCKNNCTSYAAYILNEVYGISFNNSYRGTNWGDGKHWNDAAGAISGQQHIIVDSNPLPGDIAYWESMYSGDFHGHVAVVEKVHFDGNGGVTSIDITEYNYSGNGCAFGSRNVSSSYPSGFIHILAYEEGVTSLFYLDSYETSAPGQTKQEWGWILSRVWNNYHCTNCNSNYNSNYISAIAQSVGGMGGGPGYQTVPTESPDPNLPNFVVNSLVLKDNSGVEKYSFKKSETMQMHSYSKNIGDANWAAFPGQSEADHIHFKFYLSNGYKEDDHDNWIRVGNEQIQKGNLNVGETKHEWATLNLATANNGSPLALGVYNIVGCVDRESDEDNGDGAVPEKHRSDNCSTEAVFTVEGLSNLSVSVIQIENMNGNVITMAEPGNTVRILALARNIGYAIETAQGTYIAIPFYASVNDGITFELIGTVNVTVSDLTVADSEKYVVMEYAIPSTYNLGMSLIFKTFIDSQDIVSESKEGDSNWSNTKSLVLQIDGYVPSSTPPPATGDCFNLNGGNIPLSCISVFMMLLD